MMRKTVFVTMLLGFWGAAILFFNSNCFAQSAYEQMQQAEHDGWESSHTTDLEEARHEAGHVFDTPSDSPPPVDLSDTEHPTPGLLRNPDGSNPYTPEQYRSLRPSPVPPPPSSE